MMNGATIEMVQSRVASALSESHAYNHKWCLILCKLCGHNINIVCPVGLWGKCKFYWRQFFHTIHLLLVEIQSVNTQLCNFLWDKDTYEHNMYILIWLLHGNVEIHRYGKSTHTVMEIMHTYTFATKI